MTSKTVALSKVTGEGHVKVMLKLPHDAAETLRQLSDTMRSRLKNLGILAVQVGENKQSAKSSGSTSASQFLPKLCATTVPCDFETPCQDISVGASCLKSEGRVRKRRKRRSTADSPATNGSAAPVSSTEQDMELNNLQSHTQGSHHISTFFAGTATYDNVSCRKDIGQLEEVAETAACMDMWGDGSLLSDSSQLDPTKYGQFSKIYANPRPNHGRLKINIVPRSHPEQCQDAQRPVMASASMPNVSPVRTPTMSAVSPFLVNLLQNDTGVVANGTDVHRPTVQSEFPPPATSYVPKRRRTKRERHPGNSTSDQLHCPSSSEAAVFMEKADCSQRINGCLPTSIQHGGTRPPLGYGSCNGSSAHYGIDTMNAGMYSPDAANNYAAVPWNVGNMVKDNPLMSHKGAVSSNQCVFTPSYGVGPELYSGCNSDYSFVSNHHALRLPGSNVLPQMTSAGVVPNSCIQGMHSVAPDLYSSKFVPAHSYGRQHPVNSPQHPYRSESGVLRSTHSSVTSVQNKPVSSSMPSDNHLIGSIILESNPQCVSDVPMTSTLQPLNQDLNGTLDYTNLIGTSDGNNPGMKSDQSSTSHSLSIDNLQQSKHDQSICDDSHSRNLVVRSQPSPALLDSKGTAAVTSDDAATKNRNHTAEEKNDDDAVNAESVVQVPLSFNTTATIPSSVASHQKNGIVTKSAHKNFASSSDLIYLHDIHVKNGLHHRSASEPELGNSLSLTEMIMTEHTVEVVRPGSAQLGEKIGSDGVDATALQTDSEKINSKNSAPFVQQQSETQTKLIGLNGAIEATIEICLSDSSRSSGKEAKSADSNRQEQPMLNTICRSNSGGLVNGNCASGGCADYNEDDSEGGCKNLLKNEMLPVLASDSQSRPDNFLKCCMESCLTLVSSSNKP